MSFGFDIGSGLNLDIDVGSRIKSFIQKNDNNILPGSPKSVFDKKTNKIDGQAILSIGSNYVLANKGQQISRSIELAKIDSKGVTNKKALDNLEEINLNKSNNLVSIGDKDNGSDETKYLDNDLGLVDLVTCDGANASTYHTVDDNTLYVLPTTRTADNLLVMCDTNGNALWSLSSENINFTDEELGILPDQNFEDNQIRGVDEWKYRYDFTATNETSIDMTDFQLSVTIDSSRLIALGGMRQDCGDIVFYDENNKKLSYWFEGPCRNTSSKVWIKVPVIKANSSILLTMYTGKDSAQSESSTKDTFISDIGDDKDLILRGAWNMDEESGGSLNDQSGYGNNVTTLYSITRTDGKYGGGLDLPNVGSGFYFGNYGLSRTFTYEAWVYPRKNAGVGCGYCTGAENPVFYPIHGGGDCISSPPGAGAGLYVGLDGAMVVEHAGCFVPNKIRYTGQMIGWQHIVVVYSNNIPSMYVNGVYIGSGWDSGFNSQATYMIGSFWGGYMGTPNMILDEIRYYQGVLNSQNISDIYNNYSFASPQYKGHLLVRKYSSVAPVVKPFYQIHNSVVSDNTVFVQIPYRGLFALTKSDGKLLWSKNDIGMHSDIYLDSLSNILVVVNGNVAYGYDIQTGVQKWVSELGNGIKNVIVLADRVAVFQLTSLSRMQIMSYSTKDGKLVWQKIFETMDPKDNHMMTSDKKNKLLVFDGTKNSLYQLSIKDSEEISSQNYGSTLQDVVDFGLISSENKIYFLTQDQMYILDNPNYGKPAITKNSTGQYKIKFDVTNEAVYCNRATYSSYITNDSRMIDLTSDISTSGKLTTLQSEYADFGTGNKKDIELQCKDIESNKSIVLGRYSLSLE